MDPGSKLSPSIMEALSLVRDYRTDKRIAQVLSERHPERPISAHAVKERIRRARQVLGVSDRFEAARLLAGDAQSNAIDSVNGVFLVPAVDLGDDASRERNDRPTPSTGSPAASCGRASPSELSGRRPRNYRFKLVALSASRGWWTALIVGLVALLILELGLLTVPPSKAPSSPGTILPTVSPIGATAFPDCDTARNAGAAPIKIGRPGYARRLDHDGDGTACE